VTRVALLGTGKMGTQIARRLVAAGYDLVLWNRTRARAEAVGVGSIAATPSDAAKGADFLVSILTDAVAIRNSYVGIAPEPRQVIIEMSTAGPEVVEELANRFSHVIAAPILGSASAVEAGNALVYCGGLEADFKAAKPVLSAFGEPQLVGSRQEAIALKLLNNAMFGLASAVVAEMQTAGEAAGLDPDRVFAILKRTLVYLQVLRANNKENAGTLPGPLQRLLMKDLDLALSFYRSAGASTPLLGLARELYGSAVPKPAESKEGRRGQASESPD
jgi:3-hydroxyisobutyrate dehydrogenase-like beta-hydroxyacid dehydrogenase